MSEQIQEEQVRLEKSTQFQNKGILPYAYSFSPDSTIENILTAFSELKVDEVSEKVLTIAGRILAIRSHGKAIFGNLKDETGQIQFYAALNLKSG